MALPKEPRQKMINMMYLVLTAMLALNVSAEILNAFRTVNQSLANANEIIELKNQNLFGSFERKAADPKTAEKAKIWQAKALQAKGYADNLYTYIESLKTDLMVGAGQKQDRWRV
jgi:gliding motility-associated protein GldM